MRFSDSYDLDAADVLFLCSAHGKSKEFWEQNERPAGLKVIDLAQDFRDESDGYVYGLPEWQRERIRGAEKIANPGCFATAIQLALLPLASAGLLDGPVRVTAVTGSTGAGVKPSATTHFSWRSNNLSTYKVFEHQHLLEIRRTLGRLQPGFDSPVQFVPMRGDFARGIFASVTAECPLSGEEALALYRDFYADAALPGGPQTGREYQQVHRGAGEARRDAGRLVRDRQPPEGGVRPGGAEHEPRLRPAGKRRPSAEGIRILTLWNCLTYIPFST